MDNCEKKPSGWRLRKNEEPRAAALASKPLGDSSSRSGEVDRLFGLCNPMPPLTATMTGATKPESEAGQGGIILVW